MEEAHTLYSVVFFGSNAPLLLKKQHSLPPFKYLLSEFQVHPAYPQSDVRMGLEPNKTIAKTCDSSEYIPFTGRIIQINRDSMRRLATVFPHL